MQARVLGTAQDAGVPHLGCDCRRCERARADPTEARYAASLLLETDGGRYLVDATPDVRFQLPPAPLDGLLLTHEHFGHVGGMGQFGTEGGNADELPVYCTPALADLLAANYPTSDLLENEQVRFELTAPGNAFSLDGLVARPERVTHRTERAETVAYVFERLGAGDGASGDGPALLYLPDLDRWTDDAVDLVESADVAIVDGTFYDDGELDRIDAVPHPTVVESMDRLARVVDDVDVRFTHCNHTNPVLDADSTAREEVEHRGFGVVERGDVIEF